jgi:hypothetical protein
MYSPLIASIENSGVTENGCVTNLSSAKASVDLFFQIAAMRSHSDSDIIQLFSAAFEENPEYALKTLFWARDARQGAGERRIFRVLANYLSVVHTEALRSNLHLIPHYGRYDDLLCLLDTTVRTDVLNLIASALNAGDALASKWMPRQKSAKSRYANMIRNHMGLSPKAYRKLLVKGTKVVETQMCAKEWDSIEYGHVPSVAMNNYKKAFARHSDETWSVYLDALESGEAKVNSGVLYPHQLSSQAYQSLTPDQNQIRMIQSQWDAMPNWMIDNPHRILPVIDVSGSMTCGYSDKSSVTPMDVSVGLGAYIADRNNGPFKDCFITFSSTPQLQKLAGKNIVEKMQNLRRADWGMSTDIEAVFSLILTNAQRASVEACDMPNSILIISDMEFNQCAQNADLTAMESIRQKYVDAGYELPNIVFWNLNAHGGNVPVRFDEAGTALVSGFSPSILTSILSSSDFSPEKIMLKTIMSERYEKITL